jgi:molecular chaperone DnaK (HSP70)
MAEGTYFTALDEQKVMNLDIFQGEHSLAQLGELIGLTKIDGLPPIPRGRCSVVCRVEYDHSGILQFSAREKTNRTSISAIFTTKTEFNNNDCRRLEHASGLTQADKWRLSTVTWLCASINLELRHTAAKGDGTGLDGPRQK